MQDKDLESAMLRHRKENFKCVVKPAEFPLEDGEIALTVTHNGYQWSCITLLKSECEQVIAALQANIRNEQRPTE